MKTKKFRNKLSFKKETIANLNNDEKRKLKGGSRICPDTASECAPSCYATCDCPPTLTCTNCVTYCGCGGGGETDTCYTCDTCDTCEYECQET